MNLASHPATRAGDAIYRTKGSIFRGYLAWLVAEGLFETVKFRVSVETAQLMDQPPLPSTWVDSRLIDEILAQVEAERGLPAIREAARHLLTHQVVHKLVPMARGVLSVLGTSPGTLYGHWGELLHSVMEGMQAEWRPLSSTSGVLTITYPWARHPVPQRIFVSSCAGLEEVLRLCGREGTVADPVAVAANRAEFVVRWS